MRIPFVDLSAQYRSIASELETAIHNVIRDSAFIRGKYVQSFEEHFAEFCRAKHCIGVGNGTDALAIALRALGIGRGDEVLVPANSFISTSEAVTLAGGRVVFVDCDPKTYNIEPTGIMSKISDKTKAVIAVHLYGQPADLGSIRRIADEHKLRIVQDCAQAHGATIGGKPLADYGDILCFSYYPGKNLGAYGDAGAIVTNDTDPAEYCARFADHGRTSKYNHEFEGTNSRLDGIQGAILDVKLKYLDSWTEKRRALARTYDRLLKDVPDVITPPAVAGHGHVYHLYVVRVGERDALRKHLKEHGISTGVHYPVALPNLEAYAYLGHRKEDFAIASKYQDEILSLPLYPELTLEMVEYVVEKVRQFYRNRTEQF